MAAHLLKDMVGKVYKTKGGVDCTIVSYTNSKDLVVRFNDEHGFTLNTYLSSLKLGTVRSPFDKTVVGVGFIGIGKHQPTDGKKATVAYEHWRSMLLRCYCNQTKERNPTYRDCTIFHEWHSFQVFADWYYNQKFRNCNYQLDKDILVKGNKHYSPQTCCLVPRQINCTFNSRDAARGKYPQGVSPYNKTGKFRATVKGSGSAKILGVYDTEEDAYEAYRIGKEAQVKTIALEWKNKIDDNVFNALMDWTLD